MYYYLDKNDSMFGQRRHILRILDDGSLMTFPLTEGEEIYRPYELWLAEGNTPEPWQPE